MGGGGDASLACAPAAAVLTVLALSPELLPLPHLFLVSPAGPLLLDGLSEHFIYLPSVSQAVELLQYQTPT